MADFSAICGTCTQSAGDVDWDDPSLCTADDANFCTSDAQFGLRNLLYATNFGFSIPSDHTINGYTLEVECTGTETHQLLDFLYMMIGGVIFDLGQSLNPATSLSTSMTTITIGGAGNLLGLAVASTVSETNDSGFGVALQFDDPSSTGSDITQVNYIKLTVHTTEPTPGDAANLILDVGSGGQGNATSNPFILICALHCAYGQFGIAQSWLHLFAALGAEDTSHLGVAKMRSSLGVLTLEQRIAALEARFTALENP